MLKTYELMARHFGWDRPPKPASRARPPPICSTARLRAQGVVSLDSICHLDAPSKAQVRRLIEARVRRKELVPVALEGARQAGALGAARRRWRMQATRLPNWCTSSRRSIPLIIQRKRTHLILRLRAPLRGLCAEGKAPVRLFRAAGAGRRRHRRRARSEDRSQEQEIADAEMELGRQGQPRDARKEFKRRIEEELHRFERFQLAE